MIVLNYLSICLSIYLSFYLSVCLSFYIYAWLSLSVCPSFYLSVYLSSYIITVYLTIYLSVHLFFKCIFLSTNIYLESSSLINTLLKILIFIEIITHIHKPKCIITPKHDVCIFGIQTDIYFYLSIFLSIFFLNFYKYIFISNYISIIYLVCIYLSII